MQKAQPFEEAGPLINSAQGSGSKQRLRPGSTGGLDPSGPVRSPCQGSDRGYLRDHGTDVPRVRAPHHRNAPLVPGASAAPRRAASQPAASRRVEQPAREPEPGLARRPDLWGRASFSSAAGQKRLPAMNRNKWQRSGESDVFSWDWMVSRQSGRVFPLCHSIH